MDDDGKGQKTQNFSGKFFEKTTREKKFGDQIFRPLECYILLTTRPAMRRTPCLRTLGSHRMPYRTVFLGRRTCRSHKTRPNLLQVLAGVGLLTAFLW
jgi:hypothetical protein